MPQYRGQAEIAGKVRTVAVRGEPLGRIVIEIDGQTVFDKKPFIPRSSVPFSACGTDLTLRWRDLGPLTRECDIVVGGRSVSLSAVRADGRTVAPLDPSKRARLEARNLGFFLLALGGVAFWWNYSSIKEGYYYPKWLYFTPILLLGGLALVILRPTRQHLDRRENLLMAVLAMAATLGLGWLFSQWFLSTFGAN